MGHGTKSIVLTDTEQSYRDVLQVKFDNEVISYESYESLIHNILLNEFGIRDWCLSNLDLPEKISTSSYIGTVNRDFVSEYTENKLFQNDLILQHVSVSNDSIYQSDIESFINNAQVLGKGIVAHEKILNRNKKYGYDDTFNIPITSGINGNRALLSLTSAGMEAKQFRRWTTQQLHNLKTLTTIAINTGIKKFPEKFVETVEYHRSIASSQPIRLLSELVRRDLKIPEAAKFLGISESTATKHLKNIRDTLGVKTVYKAYEVAQELGYIK